MPVLRLYDGNKPLPYVLIRDEISEGGVHIIGLNGAVLFNIFFEQEGYLGQEANDINDIIQPFSQGRESIKLNIYEKKEIHLYLLI